MEMDIILNRIKKQLARQLSLSAAALLLRIKFQ